MSGPRYSQAGLQALKYGDRIVPARQQLDLLAAVEALPRKHDCPGLSVIHDHPKWRVVISRADLSRRLFHAIPPGDEVRDPSVFGDIESRLTHAGAIRYATAQARAAQLAAIQNQETTR